MAVKFFDIYRTQSTLISNTDALNDINDTANLYSEAATSQDHDVEPPPEISAPRILPQVTVAAAAAKQLTPREEYEKHCLANLQRPISPAESSGSKSSKSTTHFYLLNYTHVHTKDKKMV